MAPPTRDDSADGSADDPSTDLDPTAVFERMVPLEPYTAGELASMLDAPTRLVKRLLERLYVGEKIRKKEPDPDRAIWIREPPAYECPNCGREFEIRYLHAVFSAARFCPRCGTRLT